MDDTGWTKHTVISYLKRMEEKGAVKFETEGRTKQYYPVIQEEEAEVREARFFGKGLSWEVWSYAAYDGTAAKPHRGGD